MNISDKKFGSPEEVAKAFGFSRGTLANMRSKKIGPKYYKVQNRKVLYRFADVEKWIQSYPVLTRDSMN
jgi:predicted DNA-binding transcriptional regulator AlpA